MFSAIASIFRGVKDAFALDESEAFEFNSNIAKQAEPKEATVKPRRQHFGEVDQFEVQVATIYTDDHVPVTRPLAQSGAGSTSITVSEREVMLENENHRLEARLIAVEGELRQMKSSMRRIARELFRKELFED